LVSGEKARKTYPFVGGGFRTGTGNTSREKSVLEKKSLPLEKRKRRDGKGINERGGVVEGTARGFSFVKNRSRLEGKKKKAAKFQTRLTIEKKKRKKSGEYKHSQEAGASTQKKTNT